MNNPSISLPARSATPKPRRRPPASSASIAPPLAISCGYVAYAGADAQAAMTSGG
ncbi:hypothetical protein K8O61_11430 [Xanthomonas cerealis pv. cerealis]|uniref:hypothetical protein n=1 Tax=Xanthomonas cerealis TaxID=3390025 RepID=UPI000AFB9C61|nr:hypothetical protein [Xanthomonas translucens]UKE71433.1 hypothetical protein K8O61_11430 [Xanthomonas translucens pv. pistacia]